MPARAKPPHSPVLLPPPSRRREGEELMSKEQQLQLDVILRQGRLDTAGDVETLRAAFNELMARVPVAPDVQQTPVELGGGAGVEVTIEGNETESVILYFHGGV